MASTPKSQLEDPNNPQQPGATASSGAPSVSAPSLGSTASMGGTAGNVGTGGLAQQGSQGSAPAAGTGFMNIDRILGANQNAGADLEKSAAETAAAEKGTFDKGASDTRAGIAAGTQNFDPRAIIGGLTTDTSKYQDNVHHQTVGEGNQDVSWTTHDLVAGSDNRDAAVKAAQDALNSKYTGPQGYSYNVGGTQNAQTLKAMGNSQTAGTGLAAKQGALAAYNPGLSAIDQAIYGSSGQLGAVGNVAANTNSLLDSQTATQGAIGSEAAQAQRGVEGNVSQLQRRLQGMGTQGAQTPGTLSAIGRVLGVPNFGQPQTPQGPNAPTIAPQPAAPAPDPVPPSDTHPGFLADAFGNYVGPAPDTSKQWQPPPSTAGQSLYDLRHPKNQ